MIGVKTGSPRAYDAFPLVLDIRYQPFILNLDGDQSCTPDFSPTFVDGQYAVVEVKRAERIPPLRERFDEVARRLAADGRVFFVVHQGQIEGRRRAERAALLRRYAMLQPKGGVVTSLPRSSQSNRRAFRLAPS
ncbi:hypothetical protein J2W35_004853 [Variovorax boronicumulans]|nr:hypothetical protein [Variovorax boronicumulans]